MKDICKFTRKKNNNNFLKKFYSQSKRILFLANNEESGHKKFFRDEISGVTLGFSGKGWVGNMLGRWINGPSLNHDFRFPAPCLPPNAYGICGCPVQD
jgi:hypothetical protein